MNTMRNKDNLKNVIKNGDGGTADISIQKSQKFFTFSLISRRVVCRSHYFFHLYSFYAC
jgi:hypothetical protein